MRKNRHAFSLVEVLISIVVLALGLLGLAAVFPAVIVEQRVASDAVQGVSMEKSVAEWIEGSRVFRERSQGGDDVTPGNRRGWRVLLAQTEWSAKGSWSLPVPVAALPQVGEGLTIDPLTGDTYVGLAARYLRVPLGDRLYPSAFSSANDPRFVWDFAARRVDGGRRAVNQTAIPDWADDGVQVAFFIRRIDSGIRLRGGVDSLSEAFGLLPGNQPADANRRVPVAEDTVGRPTGDGFGTGATPMYSPIRYFSYTFPAGLNPGDPLDVIVPDPSGNFNDLRPYAAQVGQQFVDQLGVVHKVVEVSNEGTNPSDANGLRVRISPAINRRLERWAVDDLPEGEMRMLFTPQVPVAVVIRTIRQ